MNSLQHLAHTIFSPLFVTEREEKQRVPNKNQKKKWLFLLGRNLFTTFQVVGEWHWRLLPRRSPPTVKGKNIINYGQAQDALLSCATEWRHPLEERESTFKCDVETLVPFHIPQQSKENRTNKNERRRRKKEIWKWRKRNLRGKSENISKKINSQTRKNKSPQKDERTKGMKENQIREKTSRYNIENGLKAHQSVE